MARDKSPLLFSGSLEVEMQGPLDARRSVKRLTDLTDANSFPYIYKGLDVFCEETGKWYTFMGEDKTSMSNWREEGSGGGSITVDDSLSEESTNPVQNRVILGALESMRTAMVGYLERLEALETKLVDFEETRLQMTDGTDTVDKVVLTKPYVAPTPPVTNMFDLEDGVYDASGNRLGGLSYGYEEDLDTTDYQVDYTYGGEGNTIYDVRVDRILTAYPTARGIVMRNVQNIGGDRAFKNATSGALDWIVFPENAGYPTMDENLTLFDGGVSDAVGIIYVKDTTGAPWGQTSATINNTGTPLAWA